jgi:hypothetical protein
MVVFLPLKLVEPGAMKLMKRSNYLQLILAVVFFILALALPIAAPVWLFALLLGAAAVLGLFAVCKLCNLFDDDTLFRLPSAKLEYMRTLHRRGDG